MTRRGRRARRDAASCFDALRHHGRVTKVPVIMEIDLKQQLADVTATLAALAESGRRVDRQIEAVDRQLEELGRQIGGLGNKFGTFTEGLAGASMRRILFDTFHVDSVASILHRRRKDGGRECKADMLGWSNGTDNRVIVVEIKSQLTLRDLDQLEALLLRLGEFFPEHRGKTAEGLVAAVGISDAMEAEVLRRGLHLAKSSDENFTLADPAGFVARRVRV